MKGLPVVASDASIRVRRWDAIVVGSALPGLVAAARLGLHGARVLLVEEEAAARLPDAAREPFFIGSAEKESVLAGCLRALRVPLIDQRRMEPDTLALQLVFPDARIDVGDPTLTAEEWVAWGLAKPDETRTLVEALARAARAERAALLESGFVRAPRRLPRVGRKGIVETAPPPPAGDAGVRGLPAELDQAPPRVARALRAWTRALTDLGASEPGPEARSRVLGLPLEGSAGGRPGATLRDVLRRRLESLYAEYRRLDGPFRLVEAGGLPGLAPDARGESGEIWVGRVLVLNAPRSTLAAAVAQSPVPEPLEGPRAVRRRVDVLLRAPEQSVPEAMANRVVLVGDEEAAFAGSNLICLRRLPTDAGKVELLASAVAPTDADPTPLAREIRDRVATLMPFAGEDLHIVERTAPTWDGGADLSDPQPEDCWPRESEVRLPCKQRIFALDRASVAALGTEGELLLGWRGGDAIASELS